MTILYKGRLVIARTAKKYLKKQKQERRETQMAVHTHTHTHTHTQAKLKNKKRNISTDVYILCLKWEQYKHQFFTKQIMTQ